MAKKTKVNELPDFEKDSVTNAVINTNKADYQEYMRRAKDRETQRDSLTDAIKEINSLKKELFEIKKLIKERE